MSAQAEETSQSVDIKVEEMPQAGQASADLETEEAPQVLTDLEPQAEPAALKIIPPTNHVC